MVAPKPFKWVCPKCGYSKIVTPKSDVISPMELMSHCPKCDTQMEKKNDIGVADLLKRIFTN